MKKKAIISAVAGVIIVLVGIIVSCLLKGTFLPIQKKKLRSKTKQV